jgi:NAD(P)-dependent dehydrogenase (short-subunit alcohol dehydrogenase family)
MINVSSLAGAIGLSEASEAIAYATIKAGLQGFTLSIAADGGVAGVVENRGGVVSGLFNEPQPAFERRRRPRHGTG